MKNARAVIGIWICGILVGAADVQADTQVFVKFRCHADRAIEFIPEALKIATDPTLPNPRLQPFSTTFFLGKSATEKFNLKITTENQVVLRIKERNVPLGSVDPPAAKQCAESQRLGLTEIEVPVKLSTTSGLLIFASAEVKNADLGRWISYLRDSASELSNLEQIQFRHSIRFKLPTKPTATETIVIDQSVQYSQKAIPIAPDYWGGQSERVISSPGDSDFYGHFVLHRVSVEAGATRSFGSSSSSGGGCLEYL